MKVSSVSTAVILAVFLCAIFGSHTAEAAPSPGFLDKLFGLSSYQGGGSSGRYYNGGGHSDYRSHGHRQKQGRSYSDICRVVTIDAYARPGGRVYPAAPFCPYG